MNRAMLPSTGMVLCAGLGTRLRPLTDERPKPLIPVGDRPLAAWAVDRLAAAGVRRFVANAHHLAEQVDPGLRPWCDRHSASLTVLTETSLLGTGGGIRHALPHLGDDFWVFNGDVLAAPDLRRAAEIHHASDAWMTLILRDDPRAAALGAIEVDDAGRVRRILGEGAAPPERLRACVFTGIYLISQRVADDLPTEGCVVRHTLRRLLARGERVMGVVDHGPWHDLGTPARYAEAQFALLQGELQGFAGAPGGLYQGAGVTVSSGVTLRGPAALGDGVFVEGEGEISRVVAWPGARLRAPAQGVIVTPRSVVPFSAPEGA